MVHGVKGLPVGLDFLDNFDYYLPSEFSCTPLKFYRHVHQELSFFRGVCPFHVDPKPMVSSPGDVAKQ